MYFHKMLYKSADVLGEYSTVSVLVQRWKILRKNHPIHLPW